jgi:hypothetical protein
LVPINFDTKFSLFTFTSTYLIFVLFFCAILYIGYKYLDI